MDVEGAILLTHFKKYFIIGFYISIHAFNLYSTTTSEAEPEDEESLEMRKIMGFSKFDTTKV